MRTLAIQTRGKGFYPLHEELARRLDTEPAFDGLIHLWIQHTSASLVVTENADPDVLRDLQAWMEEHVPSDGRKYLHSEEGPDDMPAHIRSALTMTSLTVPVRAGKMALGTWQGIYLWEHRRTAHVRSIVLTTLVGAL